jgi:hypothetical protein
MRELKVLMTTFHVIKVNANCNILEIGLTYLLALIIDGGNSYVNRADSSPHHYYLVFLSNLLFSSLQPSYSK